MMAVECPLRVARSPADAVAHVRRERRVDDLDRLEAGIGDAVEEPLTGAEQDGDEVEDELVDHACRKRLAHGRRAAGDVDSAITCGLLGARVRGVEAVADEIERRPARELDRLVLVVREDEDRSVVRRLSPHQPRQSPCHGPRIGPNMLRPITYAPRGRSSRSRARASASCSGSSRCQ
jgi:hypothetical protein